MNLSGMPDSVADKLYEVRRDGGGHVVRIVSYFPLTDGEKKVLQAWSHEALASDSFASIFSDTVSDEEWERTKKQIKKRFRDELFDIGKPRP